MIVKIIIKLFLSRQINFLNIFVDQKRLIAFNDVFEEVQVPSANN